MPAQGHACGDGAIPLSDGGASPPVGAAPVHPAFAPFARWWTPRRGSAVPEPASFSGWARESGLTLPDQRALSFPPSPSFRVSALAYERRISATGQVATRPGSLHDACNALAWLAFPQTKAALNAVHAASAGSLSGDRRDRRRDAATLLDESGMIVACDVPALVALWRAREWRAAFWDRRGEVAMHLRAVVIGHGLLAKLVAPFRGITARVLLLPLDGAALPTAPSLLAGMLDRAAAAWIGSRAAAFAPEDLLALPVAALPGWDTEGMGARLFEDTAVFRPRMLR